MEKSRRERSRCVPPPPPPLPQLQPITHSTGMQLPGAWRGWMCTAAASGPPVAFPSPSGCASLLWSQPGVPAVGCGTLLPLALLGSRARKALDQAVPWAMCSEGWVGVGLPGSCSVQTSQQQHCWVTFCLFLPQKKPLYKAVSPFRRDSGSWVSWQVWVGAGAPLDAPKQPKQD